MSSLSASDLEQRLISLRDENPELFDDIYHAIKLKTRPTRPLFPNDRPVSTIKHIPEEEIQAFKEKYIDMSSIDDYGSPEAKERLNPSGKVRDTQYKRWEWACSNFDIYVNMLRVMGHPDGAIQRMIDGVPLCFRSAEVMEELKESLKSLKVELEKENGWGNVGFVITGSSVPGFSQNPMKGKELVPTRITSTESSDVDICILGDGVEVFVHKLRKSGIWTRSYPTTCSRTRSGLRHGVDWSILESGALGEFFSLWKNKLEGGLQLTFAEDNMDLPPWEIEVSLI